MSGAAQRAGPRVELLGYVSNWRSEGGGDSAHVTTLGERDFRLWTHDALAELYRHRPQWLRLRGVAVGTWLIGTDIAPGSTDAPPLEPGVEDEL